MDEPPPAEEIAGRQREERGSGETGELGFDTPKLDMVGSVVFTTQQKMLKQSEQS